MSDLGAAVLAIFCLLFGLFCGMMLGIGCV